MAKEKKKVYPKPKPYVFSDFKKEAHQKSLNVAKKLAASIGTKGKFSYGINFTTKKVVKKYSAGQHFASCGSLIQMFESTQRVYDPYKDANLKDVISIAHIDKAFKWGFKRYLKDDVKAQNKGLEDPKLIFVKNKKQINASAQALIALCKFIDYAMRCKYSMMVTWRLENHEHYVAKANCLSQGLLAQIKKDGKFLIKCDYALVLKALFVWLNTIRSLIAWASNLKPAEFYCYKQRKFLYKTLNAMAIDTKSNNENFLPALCLALINENDCVDYYKNFAHKMDKLLVKAKKPYNLIRAIYYFGRFDDGRYGTLVGKLMKQIEAAINMKSVKKSGDVVVAKKSSFATMQNMLNVLYLSATFKPYY